MAQERSDDSVSRARVTIARVTIEYCVV